jgi:AraC-like DNA-binding protein
MDTRLTELRALAAHAQNRRTETGIPRVAMVQGKIPEHILQGSKSMTIGDRTLRYDPASYFVMSIDLPAVGSIHAAETGEPYLAVSLTIDAKIVALMLEDAPPPDPVAEIRNGFSVASVTPAMLDAWLRMLRLMTTPADIPVLAPAYEREILYRVLQGPNGWMLRDIAIPDTALSRVRLAIQWIRNNFRDQLRVERLAEMAAMSSSAFHRHFKAATAMSPLQFQKQIRLLQARMLLIAGAPTAASVAFEVGYESASQFSREYARFFGLPPASDVLETQRRLGRS